MNLSNLITQMNSRQKDQIPKITSKTIARRCFSRFPQKLKALLNSGLHKDCICWNDDGTKIIIKNKEEFGRTVLPLYYKTQKFSTFIRQLNLFSFKHSQDIFDNQIYYHPQFTRDEFKLQLTRIKQSPQSLKGEHEQLQSNIASLVKEQQQLQKQFSALIEFNNKIVEIQQDILKIFTRRMMRSSAIEQFLVRNLISFGKGVEKLQDDFGGNVFHATVQLIDAFSQNNDLYEDDSINFYSNQLPCRRVI